MMGSTSGTALITGLSGHARCLPILLLFSLPPVAAAGEDGGGNVEIDSMTVAVK